MMKELHKMNQWKVSKAGDIDNADPLYGIEHWRLAEPWLAQLSGKMWVDLLAFRTAYVTACRRAGVTQVMLDHSGTMVSVDDLADMSKFNRVVYASPEISANLHDVLPRQSRAL